MSRSDVTVFQVVYSSFKGLIKIHNPSVLIAVSDIDSNVKKALIMASETATNGSTTLVILSRDSVPKVLWMADLRSTALPSKNSYHGRGHRFVLASGRDPALVNKGCDFLKDHLLVPPNWRQDENKGLIRSQDGRWIQPERPRLEDHPDGIHLHLTQLGLASD
ncbi:hypothetical protein U1Q18_020260 [Sarracenia purpurea var. burkii]